MEPTRRVEWASFNEEFCQKQEQFVDEHDRQLTGEGRNRFAGSGSCMNDDHQGDLHWYKSKKKVEKEKCGGRRRSPIGSRRPALLVEYAAG